MSAHLAEIAKTVAPGAHAVVVLDGAGWHASKALVVPDNLTLVPLPPYAPELNTIETVCAYLRANRLAISVMDSWTTSSPAAATPGTSSKAIPTASGPSPTATTPKQSVVGAVGIGR